MSLCNSSDWKWPLKFGFLLDLDLSCLDLISIYVPVTNFVHALVIPTVMHIDFVCNFTQLGVC